jgi:hypothetical protein
VTRDTLCQRLTLNGWNGDRGMKIVILIVASLLGGAGAKAQDVKPQPVKSRSPADATAHSKHKPETPHLEFVTEYIHELAAIEDIRESGEKELKDDPQATFTGCIHSATLMQLELASQSSQLKQMRLEDPFNELIPNIVEFYQEKIGLWKQLSDICGAFVGGPKPNVDYDTLATDMPKVRAKLDFIDKALFEASPAVFLTLVDMKPDSQGHASHLIITKAERKKLIETIDTAFGSKLDEKGANYGVTSAWILKQGLQKDYKSSDDPWD